jgi:thymidylate synthase (FAD)
MKVELVAKSQGVGVLEGKSMDEIIVAMARVSTSKSGDDLFSNPEKLITYCVSNQHWSIFEHMYLTFSIHTSRAMGRQILRHRSAVFQEFSQRYAEASDTEPIELRHQAVKNRQSSLEPVDNDLLMTLVNETIDDINNVYSFLIQQGVAKETARMILPEATSTHLYMTMNVRSIITFLNLRLNQHAQREIREIAEQMRDIFIQEFPITSAALGNFENAYTIPVLDSLVLKKYGMLDKYKENVD